MKQTICFHALQSLPIEQQRDMITRLQQQNEQRDSKPNDETLILPIKNMQDSLNKKPD